MSTRRWPGTDVTWAGFVLQIKIAISDAAHQVVGKLRAYCSMDDPSKYEKKNMFFFFWFVFVI